MAWNCQTRGHVFLPISGSTEAGELVVEKCACCEERREYRNSRDDEWPDLAGIE